MEKKIICSLSAVLLFLLAYATPLIAQKIEVIPFSGYQTSARIKSVKGNFRINDRIDFGGAFNFHLGHNYKVELSYSRLESSLTYSEALDTNLVSDLSVSYFSIGGIWEFNPGKSLVPYTMFAVGGTYYQPVDKDVEAENVMHFSLSGGVKYYFTHNIGLRLQARLLMPVFIEGMYFEEGAPDDGNGISTKITAVQGDFTTGLIVRF
jgi:hypothetical protein